MQQERIPAENGCSAVPKRRGDGLHPEAGNALGLFDDGGEMLMGSLVLGFSQDSFRPAHDDRERGRHFLDRIQGGQRYCGYRARERFLGHGKKSSSRQEAVAARALLALSFAGRLLSRVGNTLWSLVFHVRHIRHSF